MSHDVATPRSGISLVKSRQGHGFGKVVLTRDEARRAGFLFLIPFCQCIQFSFLGQLVLSDLVVLVMLPVLGMRLGFRVGRETWLMLVGFALWLFGAIVSDVYNGSAAGDFLRGWFRIISFAAYFIVLRNLIGDRLHRVSYWAVGYALGALIRFSLFADSYIQTNPFKFGMGLAAYDFILAVLPIALPVVNTSILVNSGVLLALAAYALYSDYRSFFGMIVLTAILSGLWIAAVRMRISHLPVRALVLVGLVCGGGLYGAKSFYEVLVSQGLLGQDMQEKYEMQTSGNVNLLMAGRTELFVSLEAIADSPFMGRGSWARDPYYTALKRVRLESAGLAYQEEGEELGYNDLIPSHSVLFNSWIEAGILSVPFWALTLVLIVRFFFSILRLRTAFINLFVLNIIQIAWDIMFSPMGTTFRITAPMTLCIVCCVAEQIRVVNRTGEPSADVVPRSAPGWRRRIVGGGLRPA